MSDDPFDEEPKNEGRDPDALVVRNIIYREDGRTFMYEYLQSCGVFDSGFDSDPIQHSFNAGMRKAGLVIENKLKEYEIDYYLKMIKENNNG